MPTWGGLVTEGSDQSDPSNPVSSYTRQLPLGTTEGTALSLVRRDDVPADARVVVDVTKRGCRILWLRSTTLDGVFTHGDVELVMALYTRGGDPPYNRRDVNMAIFGVTAVGNRDAEC